MIEQLFGSKTRVKLLKLFFSNPNRPFYVREITRKIEEQINSVRRELANMLSLGLITSDDANNKLYYEVNQDYEHYSALQSMFADVKNGIISNPESEKTENKNNEAKDKKAISKTSGSSTKVNSKDDERSKSKETAETNTDIKSKAKSSINIPSEEDKAVELPEAQKWAKVGNLTGIAYSGVYTRDENSAVDILVIGDVVVSKVDKIVGELEKEHAKPLRYAVIDSDEWQYRGQVRDKFWVQFMSAKKQVVLDRNGIFSI